jgi:undecaprenyl-diphosphatase
MAATATMFFPQFGVFFISIASFVAISRIYIGVHYPIDVFIGILIGIACSMSVYYIY